MGHMSWAKALAQLTALERSRTHCHQLGPYSNCNRGFGEAGEDDGPLIHEEPQRKSTATLAQDIAQQRYGQILPGFVDNWRNGFCAKA